MVKSGGSARLDVRRSGRQGFQGRRKILRRSREDESEFGELHTPRQSDRHGKEAKGQQRGSVGGTESWKRKVTKGTWTRRGAGCGKSERLLCTQKK